MDFTYSLHALIAEDYNEAYEWYENKQEGLGERFLKAVRLKIEQIIIQPEAYGSKGNANFREASVDFFRLQLSIRSIKNKSIST